MRITTVSRRRFLQGTAASLAASAPFDALAQDVCGEKKDCTTKSCRPSPIIPVLQKPLMLARHRPHREGTYRLETTQVAGKWIVHNYGHGGAGITMSLGCAEQVVLKVQAIIDDQGPAVAKSGIAVLGGGVMGLTAATALVKRYYPATKIDLYTRETYRNTTSHVAGGQWAPSSVEWRKGDADAHALFKTILASSKKQFTSLIGTTYGVSPKTNYTLFDNPGSGLETACRLGLIDKEPLERLPFAKMNCSGFAYKTLLIEPPVFLHKLHNDLVARLTNRHVHFRTFADPKPGDPISEGVVKLEQKIIVNCTGLAAGKLFRDDDVKPIKGQLVLLPPQKLDYLFSGGYSCDDVWAQYMFPRKDALILGGTYQHNPRHERATDKVGMHISRSLHNLFAGAERACPDKSPNQLDEEMVA